MQYTTSTYSCPTLYDAPPLHTLDEWITSKHGNIEWTDEDFPVLSESSMKTNTPKKHNADACPRLAVRSSKSEGITKDAQNKNCDDHQHAKTSKTPETDTQKEKRQIRS